MKAVRKEFELDVILTPRYPDVTLISCQSTELRKHPNGKNSDKLTETELTFGKAVAKHHPLQTSQALTEHSWSF